MKAAVTRPRKGLETLLRRTRPSSEPDPWHEFLSSVEPALAGAPRMHRFARPPVIWDANAAPAPLAVWIEGSRHDAERTSAAIADGTFPPSAILDGPLAEALARVRSNWLVLVRAGDEPAPLALERLGQAAALVDDGAVITCDSDKVSDDGSRHSPCLRPGPSPDRWLACDDSGPLLVVRRDCAQALLGELSSRVAWRHELALHLAGPGGERHAHVPLLLCHGAAGRAPTPALEPDCTERTLRRWEPGARIDETAASRVVRRPLSAEPSVEVIICFRDRPSLLTRCVTSLLARTEYERVTLTLVDNGSEQGDTAELLGTMQRHPRIRVVRDSRPFHFAALNNCAARNSDAEVLVFLNNDTEVIDPRWMTKLLEEALRPQVGAVAPLLLYPDGTVQHAGVALGLHHYAGHPFASLAPTVETPFGRPNGGTRNWLAVTAACLMVERSKFLAVDGFDESFVVAGNDVDLCLRLTRAGHRSLCVSEAMMIHDESRSRGSHIDPGDFRASERSYGEFRTVGDPFYNPNLTLTATDCSIRQPGEGSA